MYDRLQKRMLFLLICITTALFVTAQGAFAALEERLDPGEVAAESTEEQEQQSVTAPAEKPAAEAVTAPAEGATPAEGTVPEKAPTAPVAKSDKSATHAPESEPAGAPDATPNSGVPSEWEALKDALEQATTGTTVDASTYDYDETKRLSIRVPGRTTSPSSRQV